MSEPELPDLPAQETLTISTPEQFKALAHPLRQRLLFALGRQPATPAHLAAALSSQKGTIAHHLKVLREAGLVRIVATRKVRGGTEHHYQRSARRMDFQRLEAEPTAAMLGAIGEELAAAPEDPLIVLRHLRLTPEAVDRLRDTLTEVVESAQDAGDGAPRYGMLVTLYRQPGPSE